MPIRAASAARCAAALVAVIILPACDSAKASHGAAGDMARRPAADSTAGGSRPNVVTITATDYTFEMPEEIPAGLTTFRLVNRGPSLHHVQLFKLEEGKTLDDLAAALQSNGPPPRWITMAGGPNPPEPGATTVTTLPLEPGNYAVTCLIPAPNGKLHAMMGMVRTLKVADVKRPPAREPEADAVMKLTDYDFQLSKPLAAGQHVVRIENAGAQVHEVAIVRLEPGKTPQDFARWAERPVGPEPGRMFGGVSGIMPGAHAFVTADLPAGEYALICFIPDARDGKPHFEHGMAKRIRVS